jgi:hypothetical protein
MRTALRWLPIVAPLVLLLAAPAAALQTVFSDSLDRFEVDGNVFGPADGTPDFVDEFGGGTLAPNWGVLLGTAIEANGVVTLQSPGTDLTIGGVEVDVSNIESTRDVSDGGGDFTAKTYWLPALPADGSEFHFQLYAVSGVIEAAGLSFGNYSSPVPPLPAGPSIQFQLTHIDGTGFHNLANYGVGVNAADITGKIVLRLHLDDATNQLAGSFSLDGGATFQSPFPTVTVFQGPTTEEFLIGAGSAGSPLPSTTTTTMPPPAPQLVPLERFLLRNPSTPERRQLLFQVKDPNSVHTVVGDPTATGAALRVTVNAAATECFPMSASNWRPTNGGYRYFSRSGFVRSAAIQRSRSGLFALRVQAPGVGVMLLPPNPGIRADMDFRVGGAGGQEYCSTTVTGMLAPNDARAFGARNAHAPTSCAVPACP